MLTKLCMSVVCFLAVAGRSAGGERLGTSVEEAREKLAVRLADHVHLRIGLGDGRGAAQAFTALAAVADSPMFLKDAAFSLLDLYETAPLPADIRANLLSPERGAREKAARQLMDVFKAYAAEYKIPDDLPGPKVLGAAEGCPLKHARAFAGGPGGVVRVLSDGLVSYDGARWQVMAPVAARVPKPIETVFVDSKGRTWLTSAVNVRRAGERLDPLLSYSRATAMFCEPGERGSLLGRWHVVERNEPIVSVAETKSRIWLAGRSKLFVCEGERAVQVGCPLPYSPFRKLLASPTSDELWVVDAGRLSRFDGKRWQSFKLGKLRARGGVMVKGKAVILLAGGLLSFQGNRPMLFPYDGKLGELAGIAANSGGEIWCVTGKGALLSTDGLHSWKSYGTATADETLLPRPPAIFCDEKDRVWLSRGLGIEVYSGAVAKVQAAQADARKLITLEAAPLVSAAGSGGWVGDGTLLAIPGEKEQEEAAAPSGDNDLGGFVEDEGKKEETPESVLGDLRKSPDSADTFTRLLKMLEKDPDPTIRKEALALGVKGNNRAFYSSPAYVSEFAESLLDGGHAAHAYMLLVDAWQRNKSDTFRGAIEPALFEALVAMGFGEFARPGFLEADMMWQADAPGAGPRGPNNAGGAPRTFGPGVRATAIDIEPEVGRDELVKAGLDQAVILADKRAALASMGDFKLWTRLVGDCTKAGDIDAARRHIKLTKDMFQWPAALPKVERPQRADSAALSPFRWIRRLKIKTDGGLAPVGGGDGLLYVLDEGTDALSAIDPATGGVLKLAQPKRSMALPAVVSTRAVIGADDGIVVILRYGSDRLAAVSKARKRSDTYSGGVNGLADSFDGFSATRVEKGVFYCFDGGLTKVELKAGKVAWRNAEIVGGLNPWRTLLERSMAVPDGRDVFVVAGRKLYCVDAGSGKIRWADDCEAKGTPAVVGDIVVVGAARREVRGINRKTGETAWKHVGRGRVQGQILSDGKSIFWATEEGDVTALEAKTGEFAWSRPTAVSIRRPASHQPRPTALLVRGGRLVACNKFGYVEFDVKTGEILRRLHISTARPMVATQDAVIVMTAPDRLVAVADPAGSEPAVKILELAEKAVKDGAAKKALGMARLVTNYVGPANVKAHELALKLAAEQDLRRRRMLYTAMLSGVDPFTPKARALMREHLRTAPVHGGGAQQALALVAGSHIERGAVREAAEAFAGLERSQKNVEPLKHLLALQLAAGQKERAMETARMLAGSGPAGAGLAFRVLAQEHMEEEALELAAPYAGRREGTMLLHLAAGLSGECGLFEQAKGMLDRSAGRMSAAWRGHLLGYLLSNAGVADRALAKYGGEIRQEIKQYRELLEQRRDALKALDQPERLKAVDAQLERLEKAQFP